MYSSFPRRHLLIESIKRKLRNFKWPKKAILIVGNEGNGVSKEVLDIVDKTIKIPIENIDSLNVGIATGILLYNYISTK